MATLLQKKALDRLVEKARTGKKLSVSATMREVGYSPMTAQEPAKLTGSQGFKELCEDLGLTDNFLVKALVADIKKKPGNRHKELDLAFKIKGKITENKEGDIYNQFNIFNDEKSKAIARRIAGRSDRDDSFSGKEISS